MRALIYFELVALPIATAIALASSYRWKSAILYLFVFLIAAEADAARRFSQRKQWMPAIVAILIVAGWLVLSFVPIWFGHDTPFVPGSSDYHRHIFWDLAHVH